MTTVVPVVAAPPPLTHLESTPDINSLIAPASPMPGIVSDSKPSEKMPSAENSELNGHPGILTGTESEEVVPKLQPEIRSTKDNTAVPW